ncbi:RNA polymerase sigma factor [Aquimarina sp. BL5]|uniref:RNA polymerase sigma factor n=1 Tax=Aquimarina sp. BL5 TaxID=1714860 RepID=UPI000E53D0B3|nr:RNA polymerase sigma factor [Aquimarina sp. BL5]AXT53756.1 RNA polymerase sigma factor [Aquimarina sp. BL5]RKN03441.1 sigma-70 family RNA polymerase sigma factor [Aquimarina sp. BL5]
MTNTNKTFDSLLVLQCQSGNKKAAAILVKRWHEKLCKQAYWYSKDIEASKDIAQDSWSTILLKIHNLKDPNSFGSWALTIVTRKSYDWLRKNKKELENIDFYHKNEVSIKYDVYDKDDNIMILLKNAIKTLPSDQQMVLHLFYLESYSVKQIAEIANISVGTVKSRLFTAREKLKQILKSKNYEK